MEEALDQGIELVWSVADDARVAARLTAWRGRLLGPSYTAWKPVFFVMPTLQSVTQ